jgi:hypothetical protein
MEMKSRTEQQLETMNLQKEMLLKGSSGDYKGETLEQKQEPGQETVVLCKHCKSPLPPNVVRGYRYVCPMCCRDNLGYGPKISISDGIRLGFGMFIMLPVVIIGSLLLLAVLGIHVR